MVRKKSLTEEDIALWKKVADQSVPLNTDTAKREISAKPVKNPSQKSKLTSSVASVSRPKTSKSNPVNDHHIRMDAKSFRKMKQGVTRPEATLDLHGMTLVQAHAALISFIERAHSSQKRLILVITGKGKKSDTDHFMSRPKGVLRSQVPQWLSLPPLSHYILQVTQSHHRHGGSGAFYVYLKRNR